MFLWSWLENQGFFVTFCKLLTTLTMEKNKIGSVRPRNILTRLY